MNKRAMSLITSLVITLSLFLGLYFPAQAITVVAKPTNSVVTVNGVITTFTAYNIGGNNYFKLRDLAFALNDTNKQFDVSFDPQNNVIVLKSSKPYTPVSGEMQINRDLSDKAATESNSQVFLNGAFTNLKAYNIDGNNYFKLRDIMQTFNVSVTWDSGSNTIKIDTSLDYVEDVSDNSDQSASAVNADKLSIEEISKLGSGVVILYNYDSNGQLYGSGTGFVISDDGQIATNFHVIEGASSLFAVGTDGTKYQIKTVLAYDKLRDIAILQCVGLNIKPLKLGDSSYILKGQEIVAIGNPIGIQNTVSNGIVSNIITSLRTETEVDIQITAPISPGSSGGPLFDMYGNVLGITYAYFEDGQNLNLAIPINELKRMQGNFSEKTLKEVNEETGSNTVTTPESTSPKMSLDELSGLLSKEYEYITVGGYKIHIDHINLQFSTDVPDLVYYFIIVRDDESITNLLDCPYAKIPPIFQSMVNDVSKYYPNTKHYGGLTYFESFYTYPIYDYDDINYNESTGMWDITETVIYFTKGPGGFTWFLNPKYGN